MMMINLPCFKQKQTEVVPVPVPVQRILLELFQTLHDLRYTCVDLFVGQGIQNGEAIHIKSQTLLVYS
jgi:hypothetical protein